MRLRKAANVFGSFSNNLKVFLRERRWSCYSSTLFQCTTVARSESIVFRNMRTTSRGRSSGGADIRPQLRLRAW